MRDLESKMIVEDRQSKIVRKGNEDGFRKKNWKQIAEVVGKVGAELSRKQKAEQIVGNRQQN